MWIGQDNVSRHPRSDEHGRFAKRLLERNQRSANHHAQLDASYASLTHSTLNAAIVDPTPPSRPDLLDDPDMPALADLSDNLSDDNDNDNVFSRLYDNIYEIEAGVEPISHNPALERERLRQAMELIRMEAEHLDMFGEGEEDEDETVTNVEGLFRGLGEFSVLCYTIIAYL